MATRVPSGRARRVDVAPTTDLGRWAVWFAIAAVVLGFLAPLLNLITWWAPAIALWLLSPAALVAGVLALIAIIRDKERALSVYAALAPMLFLLVLLVVEVVFTGLGVLPEH